MISSTRPRKDDIPHTRRPLQIPRNAIRAIERASLTFQALMNTVLRLVLRKSILVFFMISSSTAPLGMNTCNISTMKECREKDTWRRYTGEVLCKGKTWCCIIFPTSAKSSHSCASTTYLRNNKSVNLDDQNSATWATEFQAMVSLSTKPKLKQFTIGNYHTLLGDFRGFSV